MSRRDAAGQPRHARKCPADHRQQVVGDEVVVADSRRSSRPAASRAVRAGRDDCEHGAPEKNLRHHRQEPHQRAEHEIAAIDQPLFEADPQDRPPGQRRADDAGGKSRWEKPLLLAMRPPSSFRRAGGGVGQFALRPVPRPLRRPARTSRRSLPPAADPRRSRPRPVIGEDAGQHFGHHVAADPQPGPWAARPSSTSP